MCARVTARLRKEPGLSGAPSFERKRADILGRARGQAMVFVEEPAVTPDSQLSSLARKMRDASKKRSAFSRVVFLRRALAADRPGLRGLLLRQGYVYSADPVEALALVTRLKLVDLFEEETIYLQRGAKVHELRRSSERRPSYRHDDGRRGELLFGDRVATTRAGLARPLHRDAQALQSELGFERLQVERFASTGILAKLRIAGAWTKAVLDSDGAKLSLRCYREPAARRNRILQHLKAEAPRRDALRRLRQVVSSNVAEALPFDRPRGEETADRDGALRPAWRWAYLSGRRSFQVDEQFYPVYDKDGRPHPPQVCVDFVLDSYERASDTWFSPLGEKPERRSGRLDFNSFGIENRRGVLALEEFAQEKTDLFEHVRFAPEERIKFRERQRFFAFLLEQADRFRAGDIVAIQGLKNDGKVHQHAILIEATDPITGFPHALADQMKRPRRRTWEGIMAEAPLRSLLYRIRPKDGVLLSAAKSTGPG